MNGPVCCTQIRFSNLCFYTLVGALFYCLSKYTPLMADDFSFAYVYSMDGANINKHITSLWDIFESQYYHYFVSNGRTPVQFVEQLFGISGYSRLVRIIMNKALSLPHGTNKTTSCDPSRRTYRQL